VATQVIAAKCDPDQHNAGITLEGLVQQWETPELFVSEMMYHVKEVLLPWSRFPGVDSVLGPEMRSTGEAMGSGATFGEAFAKAQLGCGYVMPIDGTAFLSVNDNDKPSLIPIARELESLGFTIMATSGTAAALHAAGLQVIPIYKVSEGRPNAVDYIKNGQIGLIIITTMGKASYFDERAIRRSALLYKVPTVTTLSGAAAAVQSIRARQEGGWATQSLQERFG
jgi:carbamoyl-phosphate synthase large subunit